MATTYVATSAQISKAMLIAEHSTEAADYLETQFEKQIKAAKLTEKSKVALDKVHDFVKLVHYRFESTSKPWSGQSIESSPFLNMQNNSADALAKDLLEQNTNRNPINLYIAFNDDAALVRAYSQDGKAMDSKQVESLDKLYNAWLAKHKIVTKNSTLYECNSRGEIDKDEQGNPKEPEKVNVDKISQLLNDESEGYAAYMESKNFPKVDIKQLPFPQEATPTKEQPKEEVPAAKDAEAASEISSEKPTAPTSGGGKLGS